MAAPATALPMQWRRCGRSLIRNRRVREQAEGRSQIPGSCCVEDNSGIDVGHHPQVQLVQPRTCSQKRRGATSLGPCSASVFWNYISPGRGTGLGLINEMRSGRRRGLAPALRLIVISLARTGSALAAKPCNRGNPVVVSPTRPEILTPDATPVVPSFGPGL
jgi:hypothetical protein